MRRGRPLRLRQLLGRLWILSGAIIIAAAAAGTLSYLHLLGERDNLQNRIDPANLQVTQLLANYLNEESGVRGYALTGQTLFLDPYRSGVAAAAAETTRLSALLAPSSRAGDLLSEVISRAAAWEDRFARPAVAAISAGNRLGQNDPMLTTGRQLFDSLRQAVSALQHELAAERRAAQHRYTAASNAVVAVMIASLALILADGLVITVALRRLVLRPLADLGSEARVVTSGELYHEVSRAGPVEVAELAADIEAMRGRVVAEMQSAQRAEAQLAASNAELARSNEDLEQFAYVASHDLQEPLRKVASFCQLLEQRYAGQLDPRGEQYIAFAVDGAKRMQVLINDLLAFSRIGRNTERFGDVDLGESLEQAVRNLAGPVELTGAAVRVDGPLPTVRGDRTLLVALLQNLVGNAIKFHGEEPPEVRVGSSRQRDDWMVSVTDNGIGIEPRFAERIFVIFQRLHGREAYSGTGIGLAMCRKIVEFHGGRIWLDTGYRGGTRFCFTLPAAIPAADSRENPSAQRVLPAPPDFQHADRAGAAEPTG